MKGRAHDLKTLSQWRASVGRQARPLEPRTPLARAFRRPLPVVDEPVKTEEPKDEE